MTCPGVAGVAAVVVARDGEGKGASPLRFQSPVGALKYFVKKNLTFLK